MDISLELMPKDSIRSTALPLVRPVVPYPGIVTPVMPLRSKPSLSKAIAVTMSARVLSKPPEMPMTAFLQCMCESLVASPCT